jgi:hypothetical protein
MAGMKALADIGILRQATAGKVVVIRNTTSPAVTTPGELAPPPPALAAALDTFANPHPDTGPDRSLVTQAAKDAAAARLAALRTVSRNATLEEWDHFLFPLCNPLVMANPIDAKDLTASLPFIVPMIGYMPVGCLTPGNRLALVQRRFFPRPADIVEVMAADKRRITTEEAALTRIANAKIEQRPPVGQRRAEDELVAWMEQAEGKPVDVRGLMVRACIRRLGASAPRLLARHRARLEAMLPAQVPAAPEPVVAPGPPARPAAVLPPPATAEAQAARLWLTQVAQARASGRTLAQIQAEAARQVDERDH